jgi:hypothetical protein
MAHNITVYLLFGEKFTFLSKPVKNDPNECLKALFDEKISSKLAFGLLDIDKIAYYQPKTKNHLIFLHQISETNTIIMLQIIFGGKFII